MLTVFSRNRERICWYVVNGLRALEVPAVYGRFLYYSEKYIKTANICILQRRLFFVFILRRKKYDNRNF